MYHSVLTVFFSLFQFMLKMKTHVYHRISNHQLPSVFLSSGMTIPWPKSSGTSPYLYGSLNSNVRCTTRIGWACEMCSALIPSTLQPYLSSVYIDIAEKREIYCWSVCISFSVCVCT